MGSIPLLNKPQFLLILGTLGVPFFFLRSYELILCLFLEPPLPIALSLTRRGLFSNTVSALSFEFSFVLQLFLPLFPSQFLFGYFQALLVEHKFIEFSALLSEGVALLEVFPREASRDVDDHGPAVGTRAHPFNWFGIDARVALGCKFRLRKGRGQPQVLSFQESPATSLNP